MAEQKTTTRTKRTISSTEENKTYEEGELTSKGTLKGKKVGETPGGKELRTRKIASGMAMWEIYYYPGGEVPNYLKGSWTSEQIALNRIKMYLDSKK